MGKDPAFLFYSQDFITGTMFMPNEQIGIYIKLLCAQHQHGGFIEKDVFNDMTEGFDALRKKFIETDSGFYNERLMNEMQKRKIKSTNLSVNAKKRWAKEKHHKSNAIASKKHMPTEDEDEDEDVIEIVNDLNNILNTKYMSGSRKTRDLIRVRMKEGYSLDDFKIVHRKMAKKWGPDNKMRQFLRPITLYSPKFESYLNMPEDIKISEKAARTMQTAEEWIKKKEDEEDAKIPVC